MISSALALRAGGMIGILPVRRKLGELTQETDMKFYDYAPAPSPRRVRIFLAEKGITLPTVQVDLRKGEQLTESFRAINPDCTVPVLELDDGTRIADAVGICVYFEAVRPTPPLMGGDPQGRAIVVAAQRRAEREGFYAVVEAFRNFTPGMKGRSLPGPDDYPQIPALAERGRARVLRFFETVEAELAGRDFVCGPGYSIADITTLVTVDFAKWIKLPIPDHCVNLRRWYDAVSARPSAKA
ncbi:MAG TPA: glutathione S-transferase [Xanthobacteraceae bacterium]|jgi:glutathione S-transferase